MTSERPNTLYRRLQAKGFGPAHVAEVGVHYPEESNLFDYIQAGTRTTLVEPDPASITRIENCFGDKPGVTLHKVAVFDANGKLSLAQRDASTFVSELSASPAIVNDGYSVSEGDCFEVDAVTFDRIDDGTIDLLSVDTEGSEWFVLKHMKSRPGVISIETHGAAYLNPHLPEIEAGMADNGYRAYYKDKSDTVYVREDAVRLTTGERIALRLKSASLALRRARKRLLR